MFELVTGTGTKTDLSCSWIADNCPKWSFLCPVVSRNIPLNYYWLSFISWDEIFEFPIPGALQTTWPSRLHRSSGTQWHPVLSSYIKPSSKSGEMFRQHYLWVGEIFIAINDSFFIHYNTVGCNWKQLEVALFEPPMSTEINLFRIR